MHDRAVPLLRRAMEQNQENRSSVVDLAVAITDLGGHHPGLVTALRSRCVGMHRQPAMQNAEC
jgi:hypothetical protein